MPIRRDPAGNFVAEVAVPKDLQERLGRKKLARRVYLDRRETPDGVERELQDKIAEARGPVKFTIEIDVEAIPTSDYMALVETRIRDAVRSDGKIRFKGLNSKRE